MRLELHTEVPFDIEEIASYLRTKNPSAADRFIANLNETIDGLVELPGKGSPKHFPEPALRGIKTYLVKGFTKYLIIYRSTSDTVFIDMVVHGARDWRRLLRRRL